ncbi:uroporphyrinogen-III synthase [Neogemmobacter tilapiae]|uniref:Uroporphyrinogen III methyltransferase n=1 Tax=Neogemmobacter tilapiae TaxID=875041 RepID=A0A918WKJ8_9RHOB|nr:uroporphyrinogen-III synthase [Gemmobacter tilapiae]GHC51454.1 uroporphyrinogen III methyltransferase [Gemmobacter tilapiae]
MVRQSQPIPVLLTRPLAASQRFARSLASWPVVISPLQSVQNVPVDQPKGDFAAVLFTSENAVRALQGRGWNLPQLAFCVGDRTAEVACEAGYQAESAGGDALTLAELIRTKGLAGPFLHPHGREVRQDFAALGLNVQGVVVYETLPCGLTDQALALLAGSGSVIAPVFSPRSADLLRQARGNLPAALWFAALSPAVADALILRAGDRMAISERPDAEAMVAAMERLLSGGVGQG